LREYSQGGIRWVLKPICFNPWY